MLGTPGSAVYSRRVTSATRRRTRPQPCRWCGREVPDAGMGRRRQYCRQSCRQRAYEQRAQVKGTSLAPDAVVLTADEAADLSDRIYQVRCAAEDIATAADEGAVGAELRELCEALLQAAKAADGWR
ncbi:MAG: hypothetical protein WBO08_03710 [Mycobacterium sp.]|nr:hypothetical protein [Mycobacterium sp.]